eukprot:541525-Rhodomonas_salina.3
MPRLWTEVLSFLVFKPPYNYQYYKQKKGGRSAPKIFNRPSAYAIGTQNPVVTVQQEFLLHKYSDNSAFLCWMELGATHRNSYGSMPGWVSKLPRCWTTALGIPTRVHCVPGGRYPRVHPGTPGTRVGE